MEADTHASVSTSVSLLRSRNQAIAIVQHQKNFPDIAPRTPKLTKDEEKEEVPERKEDELKKPGAQTHQRTCRHKHRRTYVDTNHTSHESCSATAASGASNGILSIFR